jgi:hypothetical protein
MTRGNVIRLEDLLGRRVRSASGRPVGRIEEVRVERHDGEYVVVQYLLGTGAVLERWSVAQKLFGIRGRMLAVRWNQLDLSNPERPQLTCSPDEIETDDEETRSRRAAARR